MFSNNRCRYARAFSKKFEKTIPISAHHKVIAMDLDQNEALNLVEGLKKRLVDETLDAGQVSKELGYL